MASNLEEFLTIKPQESEIRTVSVQAKGGKEVEVDVKGLTVEQFKRIKKTSTCTYENVSNGAPSAQIEEITFSQKMCAAGIVDPPLNNAKLRANFNVHSNEDLVAAMFPIESMAVIAAEIINLTVGNKDQIEIADGTDEKLVEKAKN